VDVTMYIVEHRTDNRIAMRDWNIKFFDLDDCAQPWSVTSLPGCHTIDGRQVCEHSCKEHYVTRNHGVEPHSSFINVTGACSTGKEMTAKMPEFASESCEEPGWRGVDLKEVHNRNPSGAGMFFARVLTLADDRTLDLEITGSAYVAANESLNGESHGFAVLSVKLDTAADLKFQFFESGTKLPVKVPGLRLSFYDLDQPNIYVRKRVLAYGAERVVPHKKKDTKLIMNCEFTDHCMVESTTGPMPDPDKPPRVDGQKTTQRDMTLAAEEVTADFLWSECVDDVRVRLQVDNEDSNEKYADPMPDGQVFLFTLSSCASNSRCDHPAPREGCHDTRPLIEGKSPATLSKQDERKTVAIRYEDVDTVRFRLETSGSNCCGHNFLFAGKVCPDGSCNQCPQDLVCRLSDWNDWSECTVSCEGGETRQQRHKIWEPRVSDEEESDCEGALERLASCNSGSCDALNCEPVHCAFGAWQEWSHCSACGSVEGGAQRTRIREIEVNATCNGRPCLPEDAQDYESCPDRCDKALYCAWGDWESLNHCQDPHGNELTCGKGVRQRSRSLEPKKKPPYIATGEETQFVKKFTADQKELLDEVQELKTQRLQHLSCSFAGGIVFFVTLTAGWNRLARTRAWREEGRAIALEELDAPPMLME